MIYFICLILLLIILYLWEDRKFYKSYYDDATSCNKEEEPIEETRSLAKTYEEKMPKPF